MPHITLEYSANLPPGDLDRLFAALHDALADLGVALDDCKSRAYRCDAYRVGSGGLARAFAHATLAVLDRRPPEFQREAGERLLRILEQAFANPGLDCDVTLEVRPMRTDGYFKARVAASAAARDTL